MVVNKCKKTYYVTCLKQKTDSDLSFSISLTWYHDIDIVLKLSDSIYVEGIIELGNKLYPDIT